MRESQLLSRATDLLKNATHALSRSMDIVERERIDHARDAFDKALDEADSYCSDCQQCAPPLGLSYPSRQSGRWVAELKDVLTAAEYNRLAILGSSAWEVDKARGFALEALSTTKNHRP